MSEAVERMLQDRYPGIPVAHYWRVYIDTLWNRGIATLEGRIFILESTVERQRKIFLLNMQQYHAQQNEDEPAEQVDPEWAYPPPRQNQGPAPVPAPAPAPAPLPPTPAPEDPSGEDLFLSWEHGRAWAGVLDLSEPDSFGPYESRTREA